MPEPKTELKSYKVVRQLGWKGAVFAPGDTIKMAEEWAEFYVKSGVIETTNTVEPEQAETPKLTEEVK